MNVKELYERVREEFEIVSRINMPCINSAMLIVDNLITAIRQEERARNNMECKPETPTNSAIPKCTDCGKLLGIYMDGKPYHYACADKLGPLTSG